MHNNKLLNLLTQLSAKELNRFQKFVESPYFNADARLVELSRFFIEKIKQDQLAELQRETLFHLIWPEEAFHYARINQLLTELKRLLDRFLAIEFWQQKPFHQDYALIQLANEKGWDKLYHQARRHARKHLEDDFPRPDEQQLMRYQLTRSDDYFALSRNEREQHAGLEQALHHLQAFSLLAQLRHLCELLNRRHILQAKTEDLAWLASLTASLEAQASQLPFDENIHLYLHLMKMLKEENQVHFEKVRALLRQKATSLPTLVLKELHQYVRNFCIRKINQGETAFYAELLLLYEEALESGLLWEEGFISSGEFKNIVSLGLRLHRFDWTRDFMESYGDRLRPAQREAVLAYNQAQLSLCPGASFIWLCEKSEISILRMSILSWEPKVCNSRSIMSWRKKQDSGHWYMPSPTSCVVTGKSPFTRKRFIRTSFA